MTINRSTAAMTARLHRLFPQVWVQLPAHAPKFWLQITRMGLGRCSRERTSWIKMCWLMKQGLEAKFNKALASSPWKIMELLQALADHRFSKLRDSYRHLRLLKTNIGQLTLSSGNLPTIRKIAMVGRLSKMEEVLRKCSIIWEGELRAQIKIITLNPYNHNKLLCNSSTKSRMETL